MVLRPWKPLRKNSLLGFAKALWANADSAEIWCEKGALAGVIYPVTAEFDVPLMVTRGFSSETFCFEAIAARRGDTRLYYVWLPRRFRPIRPPPVVGAPNISIGAVL
jgi:hypothetical protein